MRKVSTLAACGLALVSSQAFAIPWPIAPGNQQYKVSGTLGEARPSNNDFERFHAGVDLAVAGQDFIAVRGGTVEFLGGSGRNTMITIRDSDGTLWRYIHIYADPGIKQNNVVEEGELLGVVRDDISNAHLHLDESLVQPTSLGIANPLRAVGGFSPSYIDNAPPICVENSIRFWHENDIGSSDSQNVEIVDGILSSIIDISAQFKDVETQSSGEGDGNRTSVYSAEFVVFNSFQQSVWAEQNILFDSTPKGIDAVYFTYRDWPTCCDFPEYWLSNTVNDPGQVDSALDTRLFPDGDGYTVWVMASDIVGNGCNGGQGIISGAFSIDNTPPHIPSITPTGPDIPRTLDKIEVLLEDPDVNDYNSGLAIDSLDGAITITPEPAGLWTYATQPDGSILATYLVAEELSPGEYQITVDGIEDEAGYSNASVQWQFQQKKGVML